MDKEQLIQTLSKPRQIQMVTNSTILLESNDVDIKDIFEISFHKKKEVAFRAAWMLEFLMVNKPEEFVSHIFRLFDHLASVKNQSVMRHYSKMIAMLTDKKVNQLYMSALMTIDFDPVIEILFLWLVDEQTLVASKVHSMQALANLSQRHGWITDELLQTIAYLESKESVAFFARAKMIKKTLGKQIRRS